MDIDDIFKVPKGGLKRKLEMPAAPSLDDAPAKAVKVDADKGKGRATEEDEEDEGSNARDFAPGGDADYFVEEDGDDGRFFGSGLNSVQKEVLNIMETGNADDPGDLSVQSIRKQLLALEKGINKNRDMRTKFGNDPAKFVDSEFALLEALNSLLLLASAPTLAYPILLELSTPSSLADLLSHENAEVVIAVIEVLEEWTDEEVLDGDDDEDEETALNEAGKDERKDAMRDLVEGMIEAGVVELIVSGLDRLNEEDEAERGGVYHTLGLLENLLTISPAGALPLLSPKTPLLTFLLKRLGQSKLGPERDQNRFYAAELLAILLSTPVDGISEGRKRIASEGAVDGLLKVVSLYRRRDPSSPDELEFMENVFDSLCSALSEPEVKAAFLEGEGVELCVIMMKEKKLARTRAIKTLDHALGGRDGIPLCEKFVELLGLKTLFSAFMGVRAVKKAKLSPATHEDTEHLLSLLSSLLTSLTSESPARLRLLAKFVEADYEKVDRLIELRETVETRVEMTTKDVGNAEEVDEDELYLEKLDKGLFSLQLCDYIIGWLCMEDDGVRDHIKMLLERKDKSLVDVMRVLIEYRQNIGDDDQPATAVVEEAEAKELTEVEEKQAILGQLILYLDSLDR